MNDIPLFHICTFCKYYDYHTEEVCTNMVIPKCMDHPESFPGFEFDESLTEEED